MKFTPEQIDFLTNLILFGDIHEAPWSLVKDKVDLSFIDKFDDETKLRVSIAATIQSMKE